MAIIEKVLAAAGVPPASKSGVYAWLESQDKNAQVLYIGEAESLKKRIGKESNFVQNFVLNRKKGAGLWEASGCGLEPVLAAFPERRCLTWPVEKSERRHVQTALIRLSALTGGTPPAQGAGWDYDRGHTHTDRRASELLYTWFANPTVTHLAERSHANLGVRAAPSSTRGHNAGMTQPTQVTNHGNATKYVASIEYIDAIADSGKNRFEIRNPTGGGDLVVSIYDKSGTRVNMDVQIKSDVVVLTTGRLPEDFKYSVVLVG
ncbi:hypothetical protein JIG36_48670 [Actinoplanes sp. LDG1-06]|uniref:GIY-YIG endonuclease n=1 Tax=Paractinoplanes ovalisporus TaxID=2810368 RepID=A0ABS2AUA6_9ACTN|nr:hypothetical protein [Actinoplanes ovalisporus]MBM2623396.1 hypothetical protein [Actinoplanes ovalisporus]